MENTSQNSGADLAARVADIEKWIGDFGKIFEALREAVGDGPGPTCPPYCAHEVETVAPDDASIEDRVADMARYVGDYGIMFQALRSALAEMGNPTCPPYCAHTEDGSDYS